MIERVRLRVWKAAMLVAIAVLITIGLTQRHRFAPVDVGSKAPRYAAADLNGATVSLDDLKGKVVLLNVWATWCRPCVKEMPALERVHQALAAEGLEVVAVSVDAAPGGNDALGNPAGDIRAFVEHFGLTFTVLHDPERTIERRFAAIGLPTTIVIDRSGRIARKVLGAATWDDEKHLSELRALLDRKP